MGKIRKIVICLITTGIHFGISIGVMLTILGIALMHFGNSEDCEQIVNVLEKIMNILFFPLKNIMDHIEPDIFFDVDLPFLPIMVNSLIWGVVVCACIELFIWLIDKIWKSKNARSV